MQQIKKWFKVKIEDGSHVYMDIQGMPILVLGHFIDKAFHRCFLNKFRYNPVRTTAF